MKTTVVCLYCKQDLEYRTITVQFEMAYQFTCPCVCYHGTNGFLKTLNRKGSTVSLQIYWPDLNVYFHKEWGGKRTFAYITIYKKPHATSGASQEVSNQYRKDIDLLTIKTARRFVDTVLLMS